MIATFHNFSFSKIKFQSHNAYRLCLQEYSMRFSDVSSDRECISFHQIINCQLVMPPFNLCQNETCFAIVPVMDEPLTPSKPARRGFLKKAVAVFVGGIVTVVPMLAGFLTFLDPLRRKGKAAEFIKIASLDALPDDALPHKFDVVADRTDAWNIYPKDPIGACYISRNGEKITAFNATCPHAGCFVAASADGQFHCPCHNSSFRSDGSLVPGSVSPRGLDELEVDPAALKEGLVRVKFMNFQAGTHEKIPRL
jgi:menaquinol-cytochrome c reductase iron-sulfur subunit